MSSSAVTQTFPGDASWPAARLAVLSDSAPAVLTLRGDPTIGHGSERRIASSAPAAAKRRRAS